MAGIDPIIICMNDILGKEVSIRVEPQDDFQTFLIKSKGALGYDVDLTPITRNEPIRLDQNMYDYLMKNQRNYNPAPPSLQEYFSNVNPENIPNQIDPNEFLINNTNETKNTQNNMGNASYDFDIDKIPFMDIDDTVNMASNLNYSEGASNLNDPVFLDFQASPTYQGFGESSPYNPAAIDEVEYRRDTSLLTQLQPQAIRPKLSSRPAILNRNRRPCRIHIETPRTSNDNSKELGYLSRDEILNLLKDSSVQFMPYEDNQFISQRKHIRKTDPARVVVRKNQNRGMLRATNQNRAFMANSKIARPFFKTIINVCYICNVFIKDSKDLQYLFDKIDQEEYRVNNPRRSETKLKIICQNCLNTYFLFLEEIYNDRILKPDECLLIRSKQQFIYKRNYEGTTSQSENNQNDAISIKQEEETDGSIKTEIVTIDLDSDSEAVTKHGEDNTVSNFETNAFNSKEELLVDSGKSSDIELLEPSDSKKEKDEEMLDDYLESGADSCRFCGTHFSAISEVIAHSVEHIYGTEEITFPCPLCEYGYTKFAYLRGHIRKSHKRRKDKTGDLQRNDERDESDEHGQNSHSRTDHGGRMDETPKPRSSRAFEQVNKPRHDKKIKAESGKSCDSRKLRRKPNAGECNQMRHTKRKMVDAAKCNTEMENNKNNTMENNKNSAGNPKEKVDNHRKKGLTEGREHGNDDSIWIVQTDDVEDGLSEEQIKVILGSKGRDNCDRFRCDGCRKRFISAASLSLHKCFAKKAGSSVDQPLSEDYNSDVLVVADDEELAARPRSRMNKSKSDTEGIDMTQPDRKRKRRSRDLTSDPMVLTCNDCATSFTSKVRLKFHMQFHEEASNYKLGEYECKECSKECSTEAELFDHVHFQHEKSRKWLCPIDGCGKTFFMKATLTKHSRMHSDTRRYACETCEKRFLDKQTLDEHQVTHLDVKPYQCHICLKHLTRRSRLRMHLRAHEEELRFKLVHVCTMCDRAFRDAVDAKEHIQLHPECFASVESGAPDEREMGVYTQTHLSPSSGIVYTKIINLDVENEHNLSDEQRAIKRRRVLRRLYEPEDQDRVRAMLAPLPDKMRALIRVVEIEKAFRCEFCEDVFYLEDSLNAHRRSHKGQKNPFTCHICKVSFPTYARVTTHKTTHGFYKRSVAAPQRRPGAGAADAPQLSTSSIVGYGDFPVVKHFLCEDCGRSYLHWTYLQVHRRMKHVHDAVYRCTECNINFQNNWSASYHRKRYHHDNENTIVVEPDLALPKPVGKRPIDLRLVCRDCNLGFTNKSSLYRHRRLKHPCLVPPKRRYGIGYFSCAACGKKYSSKPGLEYHLRTHAKSPKEKTYACADCAKAFPSMSLLSQHMRSTLHRLVVGVKPYECSKCLMRFNLPTALNAHMNLKHPDQIFIMGLDGVNVSISPPKKNAPAPAPLMRGNLQQKKIIPQPNVHKKPNVYAMPMDPKRYEALVVQNQDAKSMNDNTEGMTYTVLERASMPASKNNAILSQNYQRYNVSQANQNYPIHVYDYSAQNRHYQPDSSMLGDQYAPKRIMDSSLPEVPIEEFFPNNMMAQSPSDRRLAHVTSNEYTQIREATTNFSNAPNASESVMSGSLLEPSTSNYFVSQSDGDFVDHSIPSGLIDQFASNSLIDNPESHDFVSSTSDFVNLPSLIGPPGQNEFDHPIMDEEKEALGKFEVKPFGTISEPSQFQIENIEPVLDSFSPGTKVGRHPDCDTGDLNTEHLQEHPYQQEYEDLILKDSDFSDLSLQMLLQNGLITNSNGQLVQLHLNSDFT